MLLAALLDVGLDEDTLLTELGKIEGIDFELRLTSVLRSGISARHLSVQSPSKQQFRGLDEILELLSNSTLAAPITQKAGKIFSDLAKAEATVHNIPLDEIHFHEVGAVDTIVDIVGSLIGFQALGIQDIVCSPLPMGRGFVRCAHGKLPLPAPATWEILRGVPVYGVSQDQELVTPTGAVLAASLATSFGPLPPMTVQEIGYGAGSHTLQRDQPNLLRLVIGTTLQVAESDVVEIIETNLDDWNSEGFPYLCELLFTRGALDVSLCPLIMKKGRPGLLLRVITDPAHGLELKHTILSETTALGVRFHREERMTLAREAIMVSSPWGDILAKKVLGPQGEVIYPEYEACRKIAEAHKIPLAMVYRAVSRAEERKEP